MIRLFRSLSHVLRAVYKHGSLREKIILTVFLITLLAFPLIGALKVVIPFTYIAL